ncbi:MAG: elongation factor P-like protein YeiP [Pseudomonadota bacterium]
MPKVNDLKRGSVIDVDGEPHLVRDVDVRSPTARGAATLYKMKLYGVTSKRNLERTFKGDEFLREADFARRPVQFLFASDDLYTFMDTENYTQYELNAEAMEGQLAYLIDGMEGLSALIVEQRAVSIELPQSVTLEIVETTPGIKGASANARTKPATLATGLEVQVPEYLEPGEYVKVNTESGKFMSRA